MLVSIAIPTFNRVELTIKSFEQVLDSDKVSEVVISDDCSTDDAYERLLVFFKDEQKVKVYKTKKNLDCYFNKHMAVELAINDWVILFDSDNTLTQKYLDALYAISEWNKDTIYQPEFAMPHFDFRKWSGLTLTKENVAQYADTHLMTSLNACNHFVNREEYLKVWDGSVNPNTSDSIYFMYCWLNAGNKVYITPNLEYQHYISPNNDGHYQLNYRKAIKFHEELMHRIKQLK